MLRGWMVGAVQAVVAPEAARFRRALQHPEREQTACLTDVLEAVWGTEQGRALERLRTARDFQDALPLLTPEALALRLAHVRAGAPRGLTREPTLRLQPHAHHLFPVNDALLEDVQRARAAWLHDVLTRRPRVGEGPGFVAPHDAGVSAFPGWLPLTADEMSPGLSGIVARALLVAPNAPWLGDAQARHHVALRLLLAHRDLAWVGALHPAALGALWQALPVLGERLADDLERGTCRPDGAERPEVARVLAGCRWAKDPARAAELREALRGRLDVRALWPGLALVGVPQGPGADAALAPLEGVEVQQPGLALAGGVVTVPLFDAPAPALAVRSHFFEFLRVGRPHARPLLAHELLPGETYELVMSTTAGLLRYRTGEHVRVEGLLGETPCLRRVEQRRATDEPRVLSA